MVGRYQSARRDPFIAGQLILALARVEDPTVDQLAGATLLGEFVGHICRFFGRKD